ncbi:MAG: DUF4416 family protein [Smithellaceae bacterium]|nr:DUF4416 family protein [Syntrophaceae bacterium]MDD4239999.1 DUF4416 family protein [Smithellaceae bacterium]NLX51662.1 DUF4416 family protein [Deltaproteobacteria bacterium]
MSKPAQAPPVKLIFSVFAPAAETINEAIGRLAALYGPPDFVSRQVPFDYTDYYSPEMGKTLARRFVSMERLIRPESLPDVKLATNAIEDEEMRDGRRQMNVDPGYLSAAHLILATGKGYTHRPYLRDGIYADLTLLYSGGAFRALPWTYPDYADEKQLAMLAAIRSRYLLQLRQERTETV